jgi:hypothetical protein
VSVLNTQAQEDNLNRKIEIKFNNEPLYRALIRINQLTRFKFSYNSDLVNEDRAVSLNVDNWPIRQVLDSLLNDSTLVYDLVDQHIVIHKKYRKADLPGSTIKAEKEHTQLSGKVIEKNADTPLPYANIGIYNRNIGTISNEDGEFVLKLRDNHTGDTLVFSYMGYENRFIPVEQFSDGQVVQLDEKLYSIQEVIVRTFDADMVIDRALNRIKQNYYFSPLIATGFYRETVRREGDYTSVSEAVIEMYKPYNKLFQSPKIKILKSRKSADVSNRDSINLKLKAGLEAILLLDIIHENISFFNSGYFQYYDFSVSNISHFDGHNTYVIDFTPDKEAEIPLYTGKLYLDVKTLALVSAEFHLNRENLRKVSESLIIKKKWNIHVKPREVSYFVNYRRIRNKYFLNQIRGELSFKVRKQNQLFADDFDVSFEMVTSSLDTSRVKSFEQGTFAKPHKVFIEQIENYDPDFWGNYNYIKPDEPLEEVVRKLGSKIDVLE